MFFHDDLDAHKYGTSRQNQRIEGWWSFYHCSQATWWINFFKGLIEDDQYNPGDELKRECLWHCFFQLLQKDLDQLAYHWNTHYIRESRFNAVNGRPDEL